MKIAIIGSGAMGSLYGSFLSRTGNEIWLLDIWKEHIDAINEKGLHVEANGNLSVIRNLKGTCNPNEIGIADLAIVFVKSIATETAIIQNKQVFGENTVVLTLQNGLFNIEKISGIIGSSEIAAGTTSHGAALVAPGRIRHAGKGPTVIGMLDGTISEKLLKIGTLFESAGIETKISKNIIGVIWDKLIVNAGINALTALTELKNGQLLEYAETKDILEKAVLEAWEVAKAKGIELNFSDPVAHTKEVCRMTASNYSSMLQDILNKRKTEIETINGAIASEGKKEGIDTPVNELLSNLVKIKERLAIRQAANLNEMPLCH